MTSSTCTIELSESNKFFCVVGVGGHARNKIIPALLANKQQVVGLVSSRPNELLTDSPVFSSIESALEILPKETVFIVATPPAIHFNQVRVLVEAGKDVFVEKPAFISEKDARNIAAIIQPERSIVVEGFMHRYTSLYKIFSDYWELHRDSIDALDAVFLIPEMPSNTFRQEGSIESSTLYDVGCYMISLLSDLHLPLANLRIVHFSKFDSGHEEIHISGELDGVVVFLRIGTALIYQNFIELRTSNSETVQFSPFF